MDIIHQYIIHKYMDNQILLFISHGIWMISMYIYMVGGIPTPEFVSWDHDVPN